MNGQQRPVRWELWDNLPAIGNIKYQKHQLLDSVSVAEIKGVESWFNIIHFTGNIELFLMAYMA